MRPVGPPGTDPTMLSRLLSGPRALSKAPVIALSCLGWARSLGRAWKLPAVLGSLGGGYWAGCLPSLETALPEPVTGCGLACRAAGQSEQEALVPSPFPPCSSREPGVPRPGLAQPHSLADAWSSGFELWLRCGCRQGPILPLVPPPTASVSLSEGLVSGDSVGSQCPPCQRPFRRTCVQVA